MTKTADEVPGVNEPDPHHQRLRPMQGGTDSLTEPPTERVTEQQYKGAGRSGLPPLPQQRPPVARDE